MTDTKLFERIAELVPNFAAAFDSAYRLGWFFIRILGGFPTWLGTLYTVINVVIFGLIDWLAYGILAYWVGRWLGGSAEKKAALFGALAVAQAPKLLGVATVLPGLTVPIGLIRLWMLATSYQAIRSTFKLSWGRSVLIVILPYFLAALLLSASIYLGIALGLAVVQRIY